MNVNNFFSNDGCYSKQTSYSDVSFQTNLRDNFYQTTVSSVKDCEIQSLRNNSEFFLINDINNTLNNITTNCYIPRINNTNSSLYGDNSIINRSKQLFDSLLLTNRQPVIDSCDNLLFNNNSTNKKCFKYSVDNQIYTPANYYAYYKKPILNESNIALMGQLDSPEFYKNTLAGLKSYEDLLKINSNNFLDSGPLTNAFTNYVCNPTQSNERLLDAQIFSLNKKYENLYTSLDLIARDLSAISYLNSFDDDTIKAINLNIASKSKELNGLLSSGGANNGKLDDTTLLTQFKIVENSILLLFIIGIIVYLSKK